MAERYDLIVSAWARRGMVAAEFASTLGCQGRGRSSATGSEATACGRAACRARRCSRRRRPRTRMRTADKYGIEPVEPEIDTAKVWERIRAIQQADRGRPTTTRSATGRWGSTSLRRTARLTGPERASHVDGSRIEARYILLCTGSRPVVPADRGPRGGRLHHERDRLRARARTREHGDDRRRPDRDRDGAGFSRLGVARPCCRRARASCRATSPSWSRS